MAANKRKESAMDYNRAYLNIAIAMVNEDLNPGDKKFTIDDLMKKPTAELVQLIFVSALTRIHGPEAFTQVPTQELLKFNSHGVGRVTFDATVDNIYKHVLKYVPPNSNMINYTILLNPVADIKRTVQVISYIIGFTMFCDSIVENFEEVSNELTAENQAKTDLCSEIEDIQQKCAEVANKHDIAQQEIPALEATLQGIKEVVKSVEEENKVVLNQMANDQVIYEERGKVNKALEENIAQLEKMKISLEDQVVKSPEQFLITFENHKKSLEIAKLLRTQLSSQLENEVVSDQEILNVIDMGDRCMEVFEELIIRINKEENRVKEVSGIAKEIHDLDKKIERDQQALDEISACTAKISDEDMQHCHAHSKNMAEMSLHIEKLKRTKEELISKQKELTARMNGDEQHINDFRCKIKDTEISNGMHEYYCTTIIKNIRAAGRKQLRQYVEAFNNAMLAYQNPHKK